LLIIKSRKARDAMLERGLNYAPVFIFFLYRKVCIVLYNSKNGGEEGARVFSIILENMTNNQE